MGNPTSFDETADVDTVGNFDVMVNLKEVVRRVEAHLPDTVNQCLYPYMERDVTNRIFFLIQIAAHVVVVH